MARKRRGRGEGSIFQRGDGLWCATIDVGIGATGKRVRRRVYGTTKTIALEKLNEQRVRSPGVDVERLTVAEWLNRWLQHTAKQSVAATTHERYEQVVRLRIKPLLGKVRLDKLAPLHIAEMYTALERDGESRRAQQMAGMVLQSALREAVRVRLITHNPAAELHKPTPAPKEMLCLTYQQSQRLLLVAGGQAKTKQGKPIPGDRLEALYIVAIATGMRMGELFALAWPDVDFQAGAIMVQRSLEEINGQLRLKEPKTKGSRRRIDLPPFALEALQAHRKRMLAEGHVGGPVFCDTRGGHLRRSNVRRQSFEPLLARAGLPTIRFHDLRHTAATLLLLQGVHPKIVSERLGHSRVQTTLDRYSHVLPTMQKEAADKLQRLFRSR